MLVIDTAPKKTWVFGEEEKPGPGIINIIQSSYHNAEFQSALVKLLRSIAEHCIHQAVECTALESVTAVSGIATWDSENQ